MNFSEIKLTQYSHGAGCGCKISPEVLSTILKNKLTTANDKNLLVGNSSNDDAAVYDLGNGTGIISTTDFFLPIVDDPCTFGKIAATNAISDVYAMGGKPLMAIAILGWPIDKLDAEVASEVIRGGREVCQAAGIPLAGGHSIDNPEPLFGLAVTGIVSIENLKQNNTAKAGNILYLTKPLGIGALTTAQKNGVLKPEHSQIAINLMLKMNTLGEELGKMKAVHSLTDVTGFGLLGHLLEMCTGSNLTAQLNFGQIPIIPEAMDYIEQKCIPGGTGRNWNSINMHISEITKQQRFILCDPQTSGGLLIAVAPESAQELELLLQKNNLYSKPIGQLIEKQDKFIQVI